MTALDQPLREDPTYGDTVRLPNASLHCGAECQGTGLAVVPLRITGGDASPCAERDLNKAKACGSAKPGLLPLSVAVQRVWQWAITPRSDQLVSRDDVAPQAGGSLGQADRTGMDLTARSALDREVVEQDVHTRSTKMAGSL